MEMGGEKITVFSDTILNGWYVVMVVDNKGLYADLIWIMVQSVCMGLVVFGVVVLFCFVEMNRTNRYMIKLQDSRRELELIPLPQAGQQTFGSQNIAGFTNVSHHSLLHYVLVRLPPLTVYLHIMEGIV